MHSALSRTLSEDLTKGSMKFAKSLQTALWGIYPLIIGPCLLVGKFF